jgi:hypothetical protein
MMMLTDAASGVLASVESVPKVGICLKSVAIGNPGALVSILIRKIRTYTH